MILTDTLGVCRGTLNLVMRCGELGVLSTLSFNKVKYGRKNNQILIFNNELIGQKYRRGK